MEMGEANGDCVGCILGWAVLEVQQPGHHKDDLLFLGPPMSHDGGLDLGRSVGMGVDLETTEGGEKDAAALRKGETGPRVATRERGLHRGAVGIEPLHRGDEASLEIGETRGAPGAL